MDITLLIDDRQDIIEITDDYRKSIEDTIRVCLENEKLTEDYEVSVSFVTNQEIHELNKLYRNVDSPTDVLSFPMYEEDEVFIEDTIMLGDVVISTEKIIDQAKDFNHSLKREMLYLVTHSILHLIGYDHIEEQDKAIMRQHEKNIMKKLQVFK